MTTTKNSKIAIIITAAGSSTRIGSGSKKEYLPYKNGTVLSSCAKTFLNSCLKNNLQITDFIFTCPAGGIEECKSVVFRDLQFKEKLSETGLSDRLKIVEGGKTRQASVYNGLKAVTENPQIVLIHDGARPFVTEKIIYEGIGNALEYGAAVPGITPTDTQKEIDENGMIIRHLQRSTLAAVQTPQCFDFKRLLEAHKKACADNIEYTDDTEIWGNYCGSVKVYSGDAENIKITYPQDLLKLEGK